MTKIELCIESLLQGTFELKALKQITNQASATFSLNQLPGTPTFLLVDQNCQLLEGWFGHADEAKVIDLLERYTVALTAI